MLVCLLAMWVVLIATMFSTPAANATGVKHRNPKFENVLKQGGSGADRHTSYVMICGWAFVVLQTLVYLGCLILGLQRPSVDGRHFWPLYVYTGLMILLFTAIIQVYRGEVADPTKVSFWGPFPASTTLVLFGVWLTPLIAVFFYAVQFDKLVFTAEDAERFTELVKRRKQRQKSAES